METEDRLKLLRDLERLLDAVQAVIDDGTPDNGAYRVSSGVYWDLVEAFQIEK